MTLPGCVMAEIAYSTEHAHREVLAWLQVTLCWHACLSFTMKALAAAALGLHWSNIMVMLWLLLWLLCQLGERMCYGCRASQERINMSAVPTVPRVSFQPFSSSLSYPGFSEQCEQQDSWHH